MEVIIANTQTDTPSVKPRRFRLLEFSFICSLLLLLLLITELAVFLLASKVLVKLKHKTNSCVHLSKQGLVKPQPSHQSFLFWPSL